MKLTFDDGKEIKLSQELSDQLMSVINENRKEEEKVIGFHDFEKIDKYYTTSRGGETNDFDNERDFDDKAWHDNLNAFTTEEFAEKIAFKQLMERKLLKFSLEHDGDKIDWNDKDSCKWSINYEYDGDYWSMYAECWSVYKTQGAIFFYSEEVAQQAIDEFHDDLIKYFELDFSK